MRYIDRYEPPPEQGCFLCGAGANDGHWSNCPYGSGDADTDPDADHSEQQCELL